MARRDLRWWVKCVVHNVLIHPMLPAADLLETLGMRRVPGVVFKLHDRTAPEGGG